GALEVNVAPVLREFRLEGGLPIWRFDLGGYVIEKRVQLVHMQNTVHVTYSLVSGDGSLRVKLRPSVHFRPHEGPVSGPSEGEYFLYATSQRFEIHGPSPFPPLRLRLYGKRMSFTIDGHREHDLAYRIEQGRGYDWLGTMWSPGFFRADLAPRE